MTQKTIARIATEAFMANTHRATQTLRITAYIQSRVHRAIASVVSELGWSRSIRGRKERMDKKEILSILDNAKDDRAAIPMRLIRQAFDKLPDWIPVSERLPEEPGYYITSNEYNGVGEDFYYDGHFYNADKNAYEVLAWMPKPEHYKPNK